MGVTLESQNHSIDLGYGGFNNLRTKVAELTGNEIGQHYRNLNEGLWLTGEEKTKFFKEYNKKISALADEHSIPHGVLDFLYASDCSDEIPSEKCKEIYEVIKDYDDNILYGYCGREDCAVFKDFKAIVKDCVDNECKMEWF